MPNLKKLTLDFELLDYTEYIRQLATSPRSVLSGLQYLHIHNFSSDQSAINVMYEQLTNLKSIPRLRVYIRDSFFTALLESPCALHRPMIITAGIPGRVMRSFTEFREMAGFPIKRIAIGKDDPLDEVDESWLREHVQSLERFDNDIHYVDMDVK